MPLRFQVLLPERPRLVYFADSVVEFALRGPLEMVLVAWTICSITCLSTRSRIEERWRLELYLAVCVGLDGLICLILSVAEVDAKSTGLNMLVK